MNNSVYSSPELFLYYNNKQSSIELFCDKATATYIKVSGINTDVETVISQESNAVSIYPNPTTGELRIENGELRITNIQIFDIIGNKVSTLAPYSLSSKVDISHLQAGIYFIQITTEKGVVTKKVVKR